MIIFLLEPLFWMVCLIQKTTRDLCTPREELPPNHSRPLAWLGLGIGFVLLVGMVVVGIASIVDEAKPKGRYGSINGIDISRADSEACGGDVFRNCPGLVATKYWNR